MQTTVATAEPSVNSLFVLPPVVGSLTDMLGWLSDYARMDKRPTNRSECPQPINGRRECPWVGCRHHLAIDVSRMGTVTVPGRTGEAADDDVLTWLEEHEYHCVLDVVDAMPGGMTLQEVADHLGITRERVRQIEANAMYSSMMVAPRNIAESLGIGPNEVSEKRMKARAERARKREAARAAAQRPRKMLDMA